MNKLPKERLIFSNYDLCEQYLDDEIIEILVENGTDEEDITEEMLNDERYFLNECDWEDAKELLSRYFDEYKRLICFGSTGLWNGVYEGGFVFETFEELMNKATEDCYYWKFWDENGHLYLHCSHHDGSCTYEIKGLTDRGNQYFYNWEYVWSWNDKRDERYIHNQLIKRYSKLPRIAEREWGCPKREYVPMTKENIVNHLNNKARSFYC